MALSFNSRISSLLVRRTDETSRSLADSFARLSSGSRINKASDDSAGIAISSNLKLGSAVYAQGVRNVNDAVSLLNIADGATRQLSDIITRISELAAQAANGAVSVVQRRALDIEAAELSEEFNRIVSSTSFNGRQILGTGVGNVLLQLGFGTQGALAVAPNEGLRRKIGTGSFGTVQSYAVLADGETLSADLNGDGYADLIASSDSDESITVKLSNGDGTFGASTNFGSSVSSIATGDFDGNGTIDIVAGLSSGGIRVYSNNGAGSFTAGAVTGAPLPSAVASIKAADFNSDGILDVVVQTGTNTNIFSGTGGGAFSLSATYAYGGVENLLEIGDLNGDGRTDFATGTSTNGEVVVGMNNGHGTFSVSTLATGASVPVRLEIGDLDRDGFDDLVVPDGTRAMIFYSNGAGGFTEGTEPIDFSQLITDFELSDQNGDGLLDVVSHRAGTVRVQFSLGVERDSGYSAGTTSTLGGGSEQFTLGDFNGDGVPDYAIGNGVSLYASLAVTEDSTGIQRFNLTQQADARDALSALEAIRRRLSAQTGNLGAAMSRLRSSHSVLGEFVTNYRAADSRITDADIAAETAALVRSSILRDTIAGLSAQANQQPRIALSLLENL